MSYWKGKVVAVTGGAAGFGYSLATEFAQQGAIAVIIGRNEERSEQAAATIKSNGGEAWPIQMDVMNLSDIETGVSAIQQEFGRLDGWVNNVGKSTRLAFAETTPDVYREYLEINLISTVNCTSVVLPLLEQQGGHLVNIGSLSSKVAWPFVAPYTVSKHALAGYTAQVRLEAAVNTHVLLVCPGPMARHDSGSRYDRSNESVPESARKPGGGAPVKLLDPTRVAQKILRACEKRKPELVIPGKIRWLAGILQLFPALGNRILKKKAKKSVGE